MGETFSELLSFEPARVPALSAKKSHGNIRVIFCLLITLATTLWFFEFNRNMAKGYPSYLTPVEWLGVTTAMYGLSLVPLAAVLLIEKLAFKTKLLPALGLRRKPGAVGSKGKFIALIFAVNLLIFLFRFLLRKNGQFTPVYLLLKIPEHMIIALCEEVMFRGYVQNVMTGKLGDWPGILAAAVLFLVVHLPVRILFQYENPVQLTYSLATTLVGGIFFGAAARKDTCVHGAAALHFAANICHQIAFS